MPIFKRCSTTERQQKCSRIANSDRTGAAANFAPSPGYEVQTEWGRGLESAFHHPTSEE
jgi:hypothetical protein